MCMSESEIGVYKSFLKQDLFGEIASDENDENKVIMISKQIDEIVDSLDLSSVDMGSPEDYKNLLERAVLLYKERFLK